uniref:Pecanex-like protein n=1 Tax=Steinernema glaseri TaxID=37863 RepID=A0A1I7Z5S2_9BILA
MQEGHVPKSSLSTDVSPKKILMIVWVSHFTRSFSFDGVSFGDLLLATLLKGVNSHLGSRFILATVGHYLRVCFNAPVLETYPKDLIQEAQSISTMMRFLSIVFAVCLAVSVAWPLSSNHWRPGRPLKRADPALVGEDE